jgi:hypothetical protein
MNTPGNNLLGSNAAASVAVPGLLTNLLWIWNFGIIAGVVLLVIVVLFAVTYFQWADSPWLGDRLTALNHLWDWLPSAGTAVGIGKYGELQTVDTAATGPGAPPTTSQATRGSREHWCFVGEDLTGRWCVKVPHHSSCTPERIYKTRSECELVTASNSPLGVIKNGGADQTLLAALHTK